MIALLIIAMIGSGIIGFFFGSQHEMRKCALFVKHLKDEQREKEEAWGEHCKALRERYINDVTELRNKLEVQKHRKETNMKKIIVNERKYYVELDKIHLIYEDDKLVGWYRPNTEEVEVEE